MIEQIDSAVGTVQRIASELRPRILDDLGLEAALEWIAEGLEKDLGITTRVEVQGIDDKMSLETQILLFRIAQEALNNVRKHTRATQVNIKVERKRDSLTMTVTDNGKGFHVPDRAEDMVSDGRLGLMGMYERARLLDGTLNINSAPGQGTEITVNLPRRAKGRY